MIEAVTFTRARDGLHFREGKFPRGCRWAYSQYRMLGGPWKPELGTMAPMEVEKVEEILTQLGPFHYDEYRFIPAREVDDRKNEAMTARLKNLPKKRPKENKLGELQLLIRDGLVRAPAKIAAPYCGRTFEALIQPDGTILFDGEFYSSLSTAGSAARAKVSGREMSTNGWTFWRLVQNRKLIPIPRGSE